MAVKQKGREVIVQIESLSKEGEGLSSLSSYSIEGLAKTPFTVPGDEALIRLYRKRGGVYSSDLLEIQRASSLRIAPRCAHFGSCGGCLFQMLPYEEQIAFKISRLRNLFGGEVTIHPPLIPPSLWHYRNKMEFTFSENRAGERFLGLMLKNGKGRVFHLTECHLAHPAAVEILKAVRAWWDESSLTAFRPMRGEGTLRTLTVRSSITKGELMVILTVSGRAEDAPPEGEINRFVKAVQALYPEASLYLRVHQAIRGQPTQIYEMHLAGSEVIHEELSGLAFSVSPQAFFQPNSEQAERLYKRAIELAALTGHEVVWDLFCGTGTIALLAAKSAREVVGVELSREAILDAKENAKRNGIENVQFLAGDAAQFLAGETRVPDVLFTDPPRVGLGPSAILSLLRMRPKRIVYISCNPKTQAEDCRALVQGGYRLMELQPVDQFPHTLHLENIALLCLD